MPTENRSSNTEKALTFTESSLAAALEKVQSLHDLGCGLIAEAVFQQTGEQHQGEPVALPEREHYTRYLPGVIPSNAAEVNARKDGWNACLDKIAKLGPLYTHADPGEVERLRRDLHAARVALEARASTFDTLRAQLAERDALLRECYTELLAIKSEIGFRGATLQLIGRIDHQLSAAGAEPETKS
ncbi:hypothetical protein F3J44_18625 [Pantoea sp. Tr-811]|uniref:hypothetical protein n=1 Tax=Pantoea sp. Tr-811 TaxID=2608361 RepID=UPI00141E0B5A|nr:hypothetical protein [Pantoea sp. Tr-811]NIF28386.1 hypothetical protein [Pantoea sp. Tr-811]